MRERPARTLRQTCARAASVRRLAGAALLVLSGATTPLAAESAAGREAAATPVPMYKPSSRSPQPVNILSPEYGGSRSAPDALELGATAPDFVLPRAGGGEVSLATARAAGPVAIIFYRGHW